MIEAFIKVINDYTIPTYFCPVCHTDLRSSYKEQANQEKFPGQGTCRVCHLGIQMRHEIEHADHMLDAETKEMCAYRITMPVSLASHVTTKMLRDKWQAMKMPRRPLTREEFGNWIEAARAITKKFTIQ
jgi:CRISPR/Cas system-associated protein Cas10 (large subunit of type III CRISPR-Cas system)